MPLPIIHAQMHIAMNASNFKLQHSLYRYEMIRNTWYEEPEKRPSFTDIIQVLHEQNVEDTSVDETERTINTDYLNLSNSH